jgi:hypothetical protein
VYVGKTQFRGLHQNDILQLSEKQKKLYTANEVSDLYANYYIIKTNNFDDIAKDTLDEWIYFLKNSEIRDEFKAKGLREAKEKLRIDNLGGYEKEKYDNYIKEQRIRANEIESAVYDEIQKIESKLLPQIEEAQKLIEEERRQKEEAQKQKKEALAKEYQTRILLAKTMIKFNIPIENIMESTGLNKEEIEKI